jgi:glycosyltransferase involved in cell wall biosynthesis
MRVLVVSQYFWPEGFRINELCKSLVERGVSIDVLTGKPNYPQGKVFDGYRAGGCQNEQHDGINVSRVPLFPRGQNSRIRLALNYLSFIFSGLLFGPWLKRRRRYDVVFVYGLSPLLSAIPALLIGWLKKAPVVIWVQDLWPQSLSATGHVQNGLILKAVEWVVRFIYRNTDLILVQSRAFIEPVRLLASGTPIKYFPNSVDGSFTDSSSAAAHPDVAGFNAPFTVLFAGNIGSAQAVEVILQAAVILRNHSAISFVVLGEGSRRQWMLEQASHHGLLNLHLPGQFSLETMPGFMQSASVLLATLADREIFAATIPSKIQAYLAAGRPIIACMNGEGARLIIEARAGFGVPAEDANGLAEAILRMYSLPPADRDALSSNARSYYRQHFDHELLVAELIDHFKEVGSDRT